MAARLLLVVLLLVPLLSGCTSDADRDDGPTPDSFPRGILWRDPVTDRLTTTNGLSFGSGIPPGGFDLWNNTLAFTDGDRIVLQPPDGTERDIALDRPRQPGRLSLSPDGRQAVVQALDPARQPTSGQDLDIFLVDLATGHTKRLSDRAVDEGAPEWSPDGQRIAFSSFDPDAGVSLHVMTTAGSEVVTVGQGGGRHLTWSHDSTRLLEVGRLLLFDARTASLLADLHDAALEGLRAAGYEPLRDDAQSGRGTFPLDGDLSPDGEWIVFDGAVAGPSPQVLIAKMRIDGTGFEVIGGPYPVEAATMEGLAHSVTNPAWRGVDRRMENESPH